MAQIPVGIDLGTTFSALAVINPAGKPEIVPNADGERITASAVYFDADGRVIVGKDAMSGYPDRIARWFKREMGNPEWQFNVDKRKSSAIELSALVLKKLKQDAETTLGSISKVVVTVPAYFDEPRRKATMDAARIAGLDVLRIINEPTAAALAYSSTCQKTGKILVYDFGGGTFDVSIVSVDRQNHAEVITSEGDHKLGGYDLDQRLAEHYAERFAAEKRIDVKQDPAAWHKFIIQAENDKRSLSKRGKVPVTLAWKGHEISIETDRATFERLIADELTRTEMLVENALAGAKLKPQQVDAVLLVGGSTRIPAVVEMLQKKFGKAPISPVNVDEAVALGAAIQAGVIMQERGLTRLSPVAAAVMASTVAKDVANHAYGTIAMEDVHGVKRERNTIIIKKDTRLPASKKETFYTVGPNQTSILCRITQASNNHETDPEFVSILGEWEMPLPAGRPANRPIEITYSYDANQRMHCVFKDVDSGRSEKRNFDLGDGRGRKEAGNEKLSELESALSNLVIE